MKEPRMVNIKNYLPADIPVVLPSLQSPEGKFVPEIVSKYGKISGFFKVIIFLLPYFIKALVNIRKSYKSIEKNPVNAKTEISSDVLKDFEEYAKKLGCSQVGYTKVPREYIFKNKVILFENGIVLTMNMKKSRMKKAPSIWTSMEVWRVYAELGKIVNKLAKYLRKKGFKAQAGPALGGETNYTYLAQKAGLGYIGKHGLLISKENGPSQRIAAIYTNIENLPFTDSNSYEYDWIPEFCEICNRCVITCPAGAIYKATRILENGGKQHIDYKKCAVPFSITAGCSVCIKECAFFNSDFEKIKNAFLKIKERKT
jgi:Pyruvate/2-oxoacid:ferredoxin oxidoreductase delta subunit